MLIQYTNAIDASSGIKICVYGNAGMGKTRLLASAPRPLIISAENGLLSLRKFNIPYIQVNSLMMLQQVRLWLLNKGDAHQYWTIGVDSASDIAETCLAFEKTRAGKDPRKAYGEMADQVIVELKMFRDLPQRHVVMIAKQGWVADDMNRRFNGPLFPGKQLDQSAPYIFDGIFQQIRHVDQATGRAGYFLRCHGDLQNIGKDRSGNLAEYENADPATGGGLEYIFKKMVA